MHRRPEVAPAAEKRTDDTEGFPLPPAATALTLGIWVAVLLILALVVVPMLFGPCTANIPEP